VVVEEEEVVVEEAAEGEVEIVTLMEARVAESEVAKEEVVE
jgi:hypothetical protein